MRAIDREMGQSSPAGPYAQRPFLLSRQNMAALQAIEVRAARVAVHRQIAVTSRTGLEQQHRALSVSRLQPLPGRGVLPAPGQAVSHANQRLTLIMPRPDYVDVTIRGRTSHLGHIIDSGPTPCPSQRRSGDPAACTNGYRHLAIRHSVRVAISHHPRPRACSPPHLSCALATSRTLSPPFTRRLNLWVHMSLVDAPNSTYTLLAGGDTHSRYPRSGTISSDAPL